MKITDDQIAAYARAYTDTCAAGRAGYRYKEAIRAGLGAAWARRDLENATAQREAVPGMPMEGPYPATVDEVADEIARFVLELENGPARGVLTALSGRLVCDATERPDGHLFPYVCVMMRGHGGDHVDPITGKWSASGHLDADKIKRMEGAPEIAARRVDRIAFAPARTVEIRAVNLPCGECCEPGEDPTVWCDCRPDEECSGPCRRRAHEAGGCPE